MVGEGVAWSTVPRLALRVDTREAPVALIGDALPALVELVLADSVLASLRDLGTSLRHLRVLDVSRCRLRDLDGVAACPALTHLYARHNAVSDLLPLAMHDAVTVVDLHGNAVADEMALVQLGTCPRLTAVCLTGNPIAERPDFAALVSTLLPAVTSTRSLPPPPLPPPVVPAAAAPVAVAEGSSSVIAPRPPSSGGRAMLAAAAASAPPAGPAGAGAAAGSTAGVAFGRSLRPRTAGMPASAASGDTIALAPSIPVAQRSSSRPGSAAGAVGRPGSGGVRAPAVDDDDDDDDDCDGGDASCDSTMAFRLGGVGSGGGGGVNSGRGNSAGAAGGRLGSAGGLGDVDGDGLSVMTWDRPESAPRPSSGAGSGPVAPPLFPTAGGEDGAAAARRPSSAAALRSPRGGTAPAPLSPACLTADVAAPLASDTFVYAGSAAVAMRRRPRTAARTATDEDSASLNSGGGGGGGGALEVNLSRRSSGVSGGGVGGLGGSFFARASRPSTASSASSFLPSSTPVVVVPATPPRHGARLGVGAGIAAAAAAAAAADDDGDGDGDDDGGGSVSSAGGSDGGGGAGMSILAVLDAGRRADVEHKRALGAAVQEWKAAHSPGGALYSPVTPSSVVSGITPARAAAATSLRTPAGGGDGDDGRGAAVERAAPAAAAPALGAATSMDDDALVAMLRDKPKHVPALRSRDAFRAFFAGVPSLRMRTLLARAYSDLPADECAARVAKRMELVEGVLAP